MKHLGSLLLAFLMLGLVAARAADNDSGSSGTLSREELVAALTTVDNERVAGMTSADQVSLDEVLSSELRYAHANGKVDNKNTLIQSLLNHTLVYQDFEYKGRAFRAAAPGIALMTGRAVAHVKTGEQPETVDMNFLAVWRLESGKWKLLAWQSSLNQ